MILALLGLTASAPAFCTPGRVVEGKLGGQWSSATVIKAHSDECVVQMMYAGVAQTVYLASVDIRDAPSNASRAQQAAVEGSARIGGDVVTTTPEQIYDDFYRDGVAATAKYIDRQVRITGVVHSLVDREIRFFRGGYDLVASCNFPATAGPKLSRLQPGQSVTVTGYGESRVSHHNIRLSRCDLESTGVKVGTPGFAAAPPFGRYQCYAGGQPAGTLDFGGGNYVVSGVRGGYRYDATSRRITWLSGNYAKWGWKGVWEQGPKRSDGISDPRIALTDSQGLRVSCLPPR